jgi:IS5 family transposase
MTVQPKAVAFPTGAKLMHLARERLVRLAQKHGVSLRQSKRSGGHASADGLPALRLRQAVQTRQPGLAQRANPSWPGVPRHHAQDPGRRAAEPDLRRVAVAGLPGGPSAAEPARPKKPTLGLRPEGYSLHAPEVECIGKGKAHRPYEFGVKVSAPPARPLEGRPVRRPGKTSLFALFPVIDTTLLLTP